MCNLTKAKHLNGMVNHENHQNCGWKLPERGLSFAVVEQKPPTIDWERIEELIQYNLQNRRPHASFFEWKNPDNPNLGKKVKERGIVCDLIKSLEKDAGQTLFKAVRYGDDPPDSIAIGTQGDLVGFEVTELVDEQILKARCLGIRKDKEWKDGELTAKIVEILQKKSQKLAASPCTKNILVIHTDESELRGEFMKYEQEISKHVFQEVPFIDGAFILFSYFPGRETYPYLQLNFR